MSGVRWSRWLGFSLLLAAIGCHEPGNTRRVTATALIEPSELDFGDVPVGEWAEREVRITNTGYVPFRATHALKLQNDPSFHVELVEDEKNGDRVMPDNVLRVKVRFHPLQEGEIHERLSVKTDADVRAESAVDVRGRGTPTRIPTNPSALDFDILEVDSTRDLQLTVTNPVDIPLTVRVTKNGAPVESPFTPNLINIPPYSSQAVDLRYFPRTVGSDLAQLEIRSCDTCTPTVVQLQGESVASAFVFEPAPVLFDEVPVHETTKSFTRARNVTWRAVTVSGLRTSDAAFTPLSAPAGTVVESKQLFDLPIEFAARTAGPSTGTLWVDYQSDKARMSDVVLDATGGRPVLAYAPTSIDFGEVPIGGKVERIVRLTNAGTQGDLYFVGVRGDGPDAMQFNAGQPRRGKTQKYPYTGGAWPTFDAHLPIAPGTDVLELPLQFEPTQEGTFNATIVIRSDDLFNPERTVLVTGRSRKVGPCTGWRLLPQSGVDFGNVPLGTGAVLGFRFENTGPSECAVKDIRLSNDGGGAFFMPGGELVGGVIVTNDAFAAQIAFRPGAAGAFTGELEMTVNDPANPRITLPIRGQAHTTCLVAAPNYLDFGPVRYDCAPSPRRTLISNQCGTPVTVSELRIGDGTSTQFALTNPPAFPMTLAPGAGFEVEATYARSVHGQHYSPLYAQAVGEPAPLLIPMLGETNHEGIYVDRFIQGTDNQLDVLFVLGNTTTMDPYQQRLSAAIPGWLSASRTRGLDLRVGVTTTGLVSRSPSCPGGADGGEAGRLFPVDGSRARVVDGGRVDAEQLIRENVRVGLCHNLTQGLETMRAALSSPLSTSGDDPRTPQPNDGNAGFLRPSARLAVVMVTDEDDHSGFEPESYIQFLQSLKGSGGSHRSALHAVIPRDAGCTTAGPPGPRIAEVSRATGGQTISICEGSYSAMLDLIVRRASGAQADFTLTAPVSSAAELTVYVDGVSVPDDQWSFDAGRNAVVFNEGAVPTPGQNIEVRYRSECGTPTQQ